MSLCKLMIEDFLGTFDWNEFCYQYKPNELPYTKYDLEKGIDYAEGLITMGYIEEPFYEYNLKNFIIWAKEKLEIIEK
jgi:hypothetical protein